MQSVHSESMKKTEPQKELDIFEKSHRGESGPRMPTEIQKL